jgi:hypothetical protein
MRGLVESGHLPTVEGENGSTSGLIREVQDAQGSIVHFGD